MTFASNWLTGGVLASFLFVSGCPSDLENPGRFGDGGNTTNDSSTSTCGDVETTILAVKCGSSGCHVSGGTAPDLKTSGSKARLLGVNATGTCSTKGAYIVAGNPKVFAQMLQVLSPHLTEALKTPK